ncbi:hypothetical protein HUJ04_001612 [Dendroctonus ponderosae]|nr:hypothetical protein HUJ04_001612 [Dendroctonus ponderosae]
MMRSDQRGSDELLSQSSVSVMAPSAPHADNNNQENAKKVKLEQNVGKPSRVIHIRNIPSDVSEAEIIHLGLPFGRVTNVLVLKGKNQAFLEMGDEAAATSMVSYFGGSVAQLRGRSVYVQYSNHKELKTDQTHSNAVSIQNVLTNNIFIPIRISSIFDVNEHETSNGI